MFRHSHTTSPRWWCLPLWLLLLLPIPLLATAVDDGFPAEWEAAFADENADVPLQEPFSYPDWFKLSFLNLRDDLDEALERDKDGLILYFGQDHCPYCKVLIEENFGRKDIAEYTQHHFDLVPINIHGGKPVTGMDGQLFASERAFSEHHNADLTPILQFFNREGAQVLRLRGYYPPYKFRAALEYVAGEHYRNESFRDFLNRADPPLSFDGELNDERFFLKPPYALDRSQMPGEKLLLVLFEQRDCHACDVLHSRPLQNPLIRDLLRSFEVVQLDMWADTPVLTPTGERTTARRWAEDLELFYTPTLLFFDQNGEEIMRVDSVVYFFRMQRVLHYLLSGVWHQGMSVQGWLKYLEQEYRRSQQLDRTSTTGERD